MWNARCEIITRSGFTLSIRADFVGRFGDEALDRNGSVLSQIVRVVPDDDREYARGYWNVKVNAWMNLSSLMQTTGVTTFRVGLGG
ncbi:MAG: hypothetical protein ACKOAG_12815, partial [Candidatus Kapaibacterium sp.]